MEFLTPVQQACYERIVPMIKELFGEAFIQADSDYPFFWLNLGSAQVRIFVWPLGEDESTIEVYSVVIRGVENTLELMQYLLHANAEMRFGAFGLDSDGDVIFQHTIIGDTCDKPELKAAILAVASTADQKDDEIVARFGGHRAIDVANGTVNTGTS